MKVVIIGGGGNVAEAMAAFLLERGISLSVWRFKEHVHVPGTPLRPSRDIERLNKTELRPRVGLSEYAHSSKTVWASEADLNQADIIIFSMPSYMAEYAARALGRYISNKILLNVSDRFLGTYAFLRVMQRNKFPMPSISIAFNGVPLMSQKKRRDGFNVLFHVKPRHSYTYWPPEKKAEAEESLNYLFGIYPEQLKQFAGWLPLAFENVHCIEHAVADLANLKKLHYSNPTLLYSEDAYDAEITGRISRISLERDVIAQKIVGRCFSSLTDYDHNVFPTLHDDLKSLAGLEKYRQHHEALRHAPAPDVVGAFGYEDIGWAMVPMESVAKSVGVDTPHLSALINNWNELQGVNYRKVGRIIRPEDVKALLLDMNKYSAGA